MGPLPELDQIAFVACSTKLSDLEDAHADHLEPIVRGYIQAPPQHEG